MSESRNCGKSVLVRAKTKLEKQRWEWLARRRKVSLSELMREMLHGEWMNERVMQHAEIADAEQRKAVGQ